MKALSESTRIWRLEAGPTPRYAAPSSTDVGVAYEIVVHNADPGDLSCNCKAAENGRFCKHLRSVLLALDIANELQLATEAAVEDREKAKINARLEQQLAGIGL